MARASALVNSLALGAGFEEALLELGVVKYFDIQLCFCMPVLFPRGVVGVDWDGGVSCGALGVRDVEFSDGTMLAE